MSTLRDKATGALLFPDLRESDVADWHIAWHETHPETKAWQELCSKGAKVEGYTASPIGTGRKRFFPDGANKDGATANHSIQCSSAEIMNAALIKIAEQIPYKKWTPHTGLFLQVHDYIGVIVPREYGEYAKAVIEKALNTSVFGIKITATAQISDRLSDQ